MKYLIDPDPSAYYIEKESACQSWCRRLLPQAAIRP